MTKRRLVALVVAVGILAGGAACASKDADKLMLKKIVNRSLSESGTYKYSDDTPVGFAGEARQVFVAGLIEDDFRFKARVALNGNNILEQVVNDDALAVHFLDTSLIPNFLSGSKIDRETLQALEAKYWVVDPGGAPPIGAAAVDDRVLGIDPVVDSLSVIDYTMNAIDQALGVVKFNEESVDYRPKEDPFPRPAKDAKTPEGKRIERWDLIPPKLPRADIQDASGQGGNVKLAKTPVFRKMALYIADGRLLQVREQIAAEFDLLDDFATYFVRLAKEAGPAVEKQTKQALDRITDPAQRGQFLVFALNQALTGSGEEGVRYRSMVYEIGDQGEKVRADLPFGDDVRKGDLSAFGVNSKKNSASPGGGASDGSGGGGGGGSTTTTPAPAADGSATTSPPTSTP